MAFSRRDILKAATRGAASLSILGASSTLAHAHTDRRLLEPVTIPMGVGKTIDAFLAEPQYGSGPTILVLHDHWGANEDAKALTSDFARKGYIALMPDLYNGQTTRDHGEAHELTGNLNEHDVFTITKSCHEWLVANPHSSGPIGVIGIGAGGAQALQASFWLPFDASAIYSCDVGEVPAADRLSLMKGPIIGHFSNNDSSINKQKTEAYSQAVNAGGQSFEVHWYDADPAISDQGSGDYDYFSVSLSWARTLGFFDKHLRG